MTKQKYILYKNESRKFLILLNTENLSRLNFEVELAGEGAEAKIYGIVVGKKNDSFKLTTLQKHSASNTTSNLLIKGVFFDKSSFKYRGLIQIAKNTQNANAFQKQDNLVLSENMDIDTRPELEIGADEVRCTHAATISPIDKEQVFYLRSRGLSKKQAESLIIKGFLRDVVKNFSDKKVPMVT